MSTGRDTATSQVPSAHVAYRVPAGRDAADPLPSGVASAEPSRVAEPYPVSSSATASAAGQVRGAGRGGTAGSLTGTPGRRDRGPGPCSATGLPGPVPKRSRAVRAPDLTRLVDDRPGALGRAVVARRRFQRGGARPPGVLAARLPGGRGPGRGGVPWGHDA